MADEITASNGDFQDISTFAIDRFVEPIRKAFRLLSVALLTLVIVLPALQIFLREVTQTSFIGAAELARFMLICTVFIAFPYVVSSGANIRMEEIQLALPAAIVRWLRPLISFLGVVGFAIIAYSTCIATISNLNNANRSSYNIPNNSNTSRNNKGLGPRRARRTPLRSRVYSIWRKRSINCRATP